MTKCTRMFFFFLHDLMNLFHFLYFMLKDVTNIHVLYGGKGCL